MSELGPVGERNVCLFVMGPERIESRGGNSPGQEAGDLGASFWSTENLAFDPGQVISSSAPQNPHL